MGEAVAVAHRVGDATGQPGAGLLRRSQHTHHHVATTGPPKTAALPAMAGPKATYRSAGQPKILVSADSERNDGRTVRSIRPVGQRRRGRWTGTVAGWLGETCPTGR